MDNLCGTDAFNLASAYFAVYSYELLAHALGKIAGVRFLFGDPTSVEGLAPSANEPRPFKFNRAGTETQPCVEWVSKDSAAVRSVSHANFPTAGCISLCRPTAQWGPKPSSSQPYGIDERHVSVSAAWKECRSRHVISFHKS